MIDHGAAAFVVEEDTTTLVERVPIIVNQALSPQSVLLI